MQQPFMWIDTGDGWRLINDSEQPVTALAGFSVQWGTDSPADQPEPAVLSFGLLDRTGHVAGHAATFAGLRVLIQLSAQPCYSDLTDAPYHSCAASAASLHATYTPPKPSSTMSSATTIFDGIVSTGGEIEKTSRGWIISLSATSRMVLWKRMQSQGPTSSDARYAGQHWIGSPKDRLTELNRRAAEASAPQALTDGLDLPTACTPYQDDYPSQLDLLHRLFATNRRFPLWCETPSGDKTAISATMLADVTPVGIDDTGRLFVRHGSEKRPALTGDMVSADAAFAVPEPYTQLTIKTKQVKENGDGGLEYSDADTIIGATSLPAQLKTTQKSLSIESDVPTSSTTTKWQQIWQPSDTDRAAVDTLLTTIDLRLRPQNVVFDSLHVDPARRPELYVCSPSGAMLLSGIVASGLTGTDGRPSVSGAWTTIGGTLTFSWQDGRPRFRHETTLWPLPQSSTSVAWQDLTSWTAAFDLLHTVTIAEIGIVTDFTTSTSQEG